MKLPTNFMGISTEEAYKKYLEKPEEERKPRENRRPIPSTVPNSNSYLILPGNQHGSYEYPDLLVSTERTHQGRNWNQAHELLKQEDGFMLNIRQYVDFLKMLKSGNAFDGSGNKVDPSRLSTILEDIIAVRSPWRAEWLDAKFSSEGTLRKKWHVEYHNAQGNPIKEELEDCLRSDKRPGIDLDYWLNNATNQGLPPKNNDNGSLYYWHPRNGKVAWFYAFSDRADLGCYWDPSDSVAGLGVRFAREK